jgi:putative ABC transport system permease protein
MVGSFRGSVDQWLDAVLPAPLYMRAAGGLTGDDAAVFPPGFADAVARLPGVARVQALRTSSVQLAPTRPAVALLARPLVPDPSRALPLVGPPLPVPPGRVGVYVSEAVADLYGARPGTDWPALSQSFGPAAQAGQAPAASFFIAGVWRDYVRQHGAIALDARDFIRLTGDARASDLALWPAPNADTATLRAAVAQLARERLGADAAALEFTSAGAIRARSLAIFDRSFAVTYWLQAVAIGIGLFGVAASFGAQVLTRRKEFGLLAHLGLTRRQILAVVAAGPGRGGGAGARGQPAELPLDDGPGRALAAPRSAGAGGGRCGHAHGMGGGPHRGGARRGHGRQGRLVGCGPVPRPPPLHRASFPPWLQPSSSACCACTCCALPSCSG